MPDRLLRKVDKTARLDVYVSSECPNCGEAVPLAEEAAVRYPNIVVRVIDLDQLDGNPPPDPVVAVPTYLLDGRVVSLGNPHPEELFALLHEAVK
jgi:alkyl hydroperoxide reductase subunit AhpF